MKISIKNSQKDLSITHIHKNIRKIVSAIIPQIIAKEMKLQMPSLSDEEVHSFWSEVSFQFVTEKKIAALHGQFFDDPTITDCITFPIDTFDSSSPRILGEVFVCPKVAIDYAHRHGVDPYRETILYIVHGLLHLLGYDDLDPKSRKIMRQKERTYMKLVP